MKKTIVIVLAAVVLLVGTSAMAHGEISMTVTNNGVVATGAVNLVSYTIGITSTTGTADTFEGLQIFTDATKTTIATNLHQVKSFTQTSSLTVDNWVEDAFTDTAWAAYDTHLLLSGITQVPDASLTESNDGTNPAGLSLEKFAGFPATVGLGSFGHGDPTDAFTVLGQFATPKDFLQIVIPEGDSVWLSVNILDAGQKTQFAGTQVPEPATMTALALGGLALLRRRRK